jgi:alkanesulfonate monooxygenase SsuD/methylene tetrahydromethanopterin reductase-like flavin-dependent oxidoreductase (luciferase family)
MKFGIQLLIGGSGEQVTLKLVARYGDACSLTRCDFATLEHKLAVLKQHCEAVRRDYQSIRRTATTLCVMGETDEQALAKVPAAQRVWHGDALSAALVGSLQTIRRRIATYEALGVQELVLLFFEPEAVQRFAKACIA